MGNFGGRGGNHEGKSLTGGKMGFLGLDFENHGGSCPGSGDKNGIYGVGV